MVEHAHEDDEVEGLAELSDVVNGKVAEFDVKIVYLRREARLRQILVTSTEPEHALGTAAFLLNCVKAGIAADVQHRFSLQGFGNDVGEVLPFHRRIVAEKVRRCRWHAVKIQIVKPRAERIDLAADFVGGERRAIHVAAPVAAPIAVTASAMAIVWGHLGIERDALRSRWVSSRAIAVR